MLKGATIAELRYDALALLALAKQAPANVQILTADVLTIELAAALQTWLGARGQIKRTLRAISCARR